MNLFRRVAILFALLLVALVVIANEGLAGPIFGRFYDFPNGDKVAHFLLMGTLSFLVSLGFSSGRISIFSLRPLKSCLIISAVVALEELSQSFFPGRSASILDLSASLAGVFLLGELGAFMKYRYSQNKQKQIT